MILQAILCMAIGLLISAVLIYFGGYEWLYRKATEKNRRRGWYELSKADMIPRTKKLKAIANMYSVSVRSVKGYFDFLEAYYGALVSRTEFTQMKISHECPKGVFEESAAREVKDNENL